MLALWFWYCLVFVAASVCLIRHMLYDICHLCRNDTLSSILKGHLLVLKLIKHNVDQITFSEIIRQMNDIRDSCTKKRKSRKAKVIIVDERKETRNHTENEEEEAEELNKGEMTSTRRRTKAVNDNDDYDFTPISV